MLSLTAVRLLCLKKCEDTINSKENGGSEDKEWNVCEEEQRNVWAQRL